MLYIALGAIIFVLGFIFWRWTSVARGARKRDEQILSLIDPIGKKLDSESTKVSDEVNELSKRPEVRFMLYTVLTDMKHPELIPNKYSSSLCQAESALAYWLMHPNELQDPPEKIEHIKEIVNSIDGKDKKFHVFRYKMAQGHWAAKDGWQLGVVGPMDDNAEPYSCLPGAFSRAGDTEDRITPEDLVNWYIDMLGKKGISI